MFKKGNKLWDNPNSKKTQFKKGDISHNKGKTKENYEILKQTGEKISKAHKIRFNNPKYKKEWSNNNKGCFKKGDIPFNKGLTKANCDGLKKISKLMKGNKIWDNPNSKKTQFKKGGESWVKGLTKENCTQLRKISKLMKDGGALRARKANKSRPNKPEKVMINLIKENNLPFNYVGDGEIWFRGNTQSFNPDFLSKNPKHIIEVFGDYWHNLPEKKKIDKERLKTYLKYGYKTLVIWEHELNNQNQIIKKIKNFIK